MRHRLELSKEILSRIYDDLVLIDDVVCNSKPYCDRLHKLVKEACEETEKQIEEMCFSEDDLPW